MFFASMALKPASRLSGLLLASTETVAERGSGMFQGDTDRRQSLWDIVRRAALLVLGWASFFGWRILTLLAEGLSAVLVRRLPEQRKAARSGRVEDTMAGASHG